MADSPITDFITGVVTDPKGTLDNIKPTYTAEQFSSDVFPEDLKTSQLAHWMKFTAYTQRPGSSYSTPTGSAGGVLGAVGLGEYYAPPSNPAYSLAIFTPSDIGGGGGVMYMDKHEYADVRLTNLGGNVVGAASGGTISAAGIVPALLGHPINPGVEVLYRSTSLRRFEYSFLMAPSSEKESIALKSIVKKLRRFAAPKQNETVKFLFDTPAEWTIEFYYKGQINQSIPKVRRCVLTDININYSPQGEWSTFKNGHPVSCLLALGFSEMEIITRQHVDAGF